MGCREPAIGGYLVPHWKPAVGQQRSIPVAQNDTLLTTEIEGIIARDNFVIERVTWINSRVGWCGEDDTGA